MRAYRSITAATVLEMLSEPLSFLLLLTALSVEVLAPALHYHQFGEAVRTARDAGFSALFTCGAAFSVFTTVRVFRREIETGTYEMALSHPVSRGGFFLAKTAGALIASLVFSLTVFGTGLVMYKGAETGGLIAAQTGTIVRVHGPFLAYGTAVIVLPLAAGAFCNRFFRARFVLTSLLVSFVLSLAGGVVSAAMTLDAALKMIPVFALLLCPSAVVLSAAAAFSMRFKANGAAAASAVFFAAALPAMDNYCRVEELAGGGSLPPEEFLFALLFALPALAAFLILGVHFSLRRE